MTVSPPLAAGAGEVVLYEEPTGFKSGNTTIYNMQDMTTSVCTNAANGATGRLRDTRDKKVYWVTKFKNMCWMAQNLDLDLDENVSLTSADTDVNHAVTLATTQTGMPNFIDSAGITQSFDPGYYVYSAISATGACNAASLSQCSGFTNILNGIWQSSNDANFTGAIDDTTKTYNAHYLVGNYYSYAAATAGTGPGTTGTAEYSICPKGWKLPTGGNDSSRDFYKAFSGVTVAQVTAAPYYFVFAGRVTGGSMSNVGFDGYLWASVATAADDANAMYAASTKVTPGDYSGRRRGCSVRCVAR